MNIERAGITCGCRNIVPLFLAEAPIHKQAPRATVHTTGSKKNKQKLAIQLLVKLNDKNEER
jgi:hypothetical protein